MPRIFRKTNAPLGWLKTWFEPPCPNAGGRQQLSGSQQSTSRQPAASQQAGGSQPAASSRQPADSKQPAHKLPADSHQTTGRQPAGSQRAASQPVSSQQAASRQPAGSKQAASRQPAGSQRAGSQHAASRRCRPIPTSWKPECWGPPNFPFPVPRNTLPFSPHPFPGTNEDERSCVLPLPNRPWTNCKEEAGFCHA